MNKIEVKSVVAKKSISSRIIVSGAIASVMAMGLLAGEAVAAKKGFEKCAGIVKAGKNDCGNSRHGCAGQASSNNMADEWLYVPNGTCKKITGSNIFKKK